MYRCTLSSVYSVASVRLIAVSALAAAEAVYILSVEITVVHACLLASHEIHVYFITVRYSVQLVSATRVDSVALMPLGNDVVQLHHHHHHHRDV